MNCGVYVLQSLKNKRYYIGSTCNIERRLEKHNKGEVFSTRKTRPWALKVFITCASIADAKRDEYRLKTYKRRDILEKVVADGVFPWNYK